VAHCKASCTAQIEGLSNLCQTCLIEELGGDRARAPDPRNCFEVDPSCPNQNGCVMTGAGGIECRWCESDTEGQARCARELYPRREVVCTTSLGDVGECEAICENDKAVRQPVRSSDPRCEDTCRARVPRIDGAYEVCSETSRQSCLDRCNARIENVPALCAACLLDGMDYGLGPSAGVPISCFEVDPSCTDERGCSASTGGTSCNWCPTDREAWENCARMLWPRTEVECDTRFRSVSECATFCAGD
jgi:hypothetical protein